MVWGAVQTESQQQLKCVVEAVALAELCQSSVSKFPNH